MQGIKSLDSFAIDSKPALRHPLFWFARRHLLAGFANTRDRALCNCSALQLQRSAIAALCNCKFVTVCDRIFLETTQPRRADMEVFAFYERTD